MHDSADAKSIKNTYEDKNYAKKRSVKVKNRKKSCGFAELRRKHVRSHRALYSILGYTFFIPILYNITFMLTFWY